MKWIRCLLVPVLLPICLPPVAAQSQPQSCQPHQVQSNGLDQMVCHFEGDYCGTAVGDVWFCPGAWGQGLCAEGNGRVDLGDSDCFTVDTLVVECQVIFTRLPGPGEYGSALVSKYKGQYPSDSEFWLGVAGNGTRQWSLTGDGTNSIVSPPNAVEEGVLYCVRGVWTPGYGEIWVNDELVASGPISRNAGNTNTPVIIAGSSGGDSPSPFHGMIDEVAVTCPGVTPVHGRSWGVIKATFR